MNFKQFFFEQYGDDEDEETVGIRGEYWFDEHGDAQYADGDVSDMNHEGYVIDRCLREVADYFGLEYDDMAPSQEDFMQVILQEDPDFALAQTGLDAEHNNEQEILNALSNDPQDAIIKYILHDHPELNEKEVSDLVFMGFGTSSMDGREYAIKKWNWKRVRGDSIESRQLTRDDLKLIAQGINEAINQEGLDYENEDHPERLENHEYSISTYSGKRYSLTLAQMESGSVEDMEQSDIEIKNSAATQQLRKMDIQSQPDYYKNKGDVLGDSVKFTYK